MTTTPFATIGVFIFHFFFKNFSKFKSISIFGKNTGKAMKDERYYEDCIRSKTPAELDAAEKAWLRRVMTNKIIALAIVGARVLVGATILYVLIYK